MPNHVTTICTVTGPDAEAFRAVHIRKGDDCLMLDFNTIIPTPESIKGTDSGSQADEGFYALTGLQPGGYFGAHPCRPHGYTGPMYPTEPVVEWLEKNRPEVLKKGRKCLAAFRETGHRDWYSWNCEHWGTKWGSYDYESRESLPGQFRFKFETAWSFPVPIFRKLAEMWPSLTFAIISYDEGGNFACEGEFNGANNYAEVPATDDLYRRVYGREPDADEEDEDEAHA